MRKSMAEVSVHFGVKAPTFSNALEEAYLGTPGMVVREIGGDRVMQHRLRVNHAARLVERCRDEPTFQSHDLVRARDRSRD